MMLIDLSAVSRAVRFPLIQPKLVFAGAGLYAAVFAFQSYFTARVAAGDPAAAPWGLGLGCLALAVFIVAMAGWGRAALGKLNGRWFGFALGGDEARLGWASILILILSLTVLGTAFLAVAFMIAALALINVDQAAAPPAEGEVDLFALFGAGEAITASVIFLVFAVFSLWFFLRLAMAYPATLDSARIQIMSIWPLSGRGRSVRILTTVLAAAAPGVLLLVALNAVIYAISGIYPAVAQSAASEAGALSVPAPLFLVLAFTYGLGKAALVGAPICAALCALYVEFRAITTN